jgi:hypothetical protein
MRRLLRKLLGLDADLRALSSDHAQIINTQMRVEASLFSARKELRVATEALGKILSALQPMFARSEFDPERRAESDKLGQEVIERLIAEDWARKHTPGEL